MEHGVSAGEVGGVFAGIVALLAALGKAGQWLINWKDARENSKAARLRAWEESLDRREKHDREKTEGRLHAVEKKLATVTSALFETIADLQVLNPASPSLAKAKLVLQADYPIAPEMSPEIEALVRRIDHAKENPDGN